MGNLEDTKSRVITSPGFGSGFLSNSLIDYSENNFSPTPTATLDQQLIKPDMYININHSFGTKKKLTTGGECAESVCHLRTSTPVKKLGEILIPP